MWEIGGWTSGLRIEFVSVESFCPHRPYVLVFLVALLRSHLESELI